ncbi:glucan 1,4-alpha-maltohexaosidase [Sclerotinia borealis F-4128]|uniref:Glucan 1,4-alpha-maltohexaosidase n=1 Tax=Sclerotinia borealis (strain F-4128) TaxID=1432307 RepID=W9C0V1_SCLBF|nr:glucan 1,4-alpha-maltohexaosidase [Sclerotinia borealis F-4128]
MGENIKERIPTPENMTMLQAFEWYVPDDHKHWQRLHDAIPSLKATGIDNMWIPPACKAASQSGNGYDVYDLYDLGEFDQKGGRGTKWGNKEELLKMVKKANEVGMGIYWDAVLNHKAGADHKEKCQAQEVDEEDRTKTISDPYEIDAWLGFDFPGRGQKFSKQKYHWYHFSGTDYNANNDQTAIYKILGDKTKDWANADDVDSEKGNYDYLMFADLDYGHPEVEQDVLNWGGWLGDQVSLKGIRFDAVKHFSEDFLRKFITLMNDKYGQGWFFVGEFWKDSLDDMNKYLDRMGRKFSLFDAPLVYNFSKLSKTEAGDLRTVFDNTLVQTSPVNSVTLVMNHDTQPYQALEAPIEPFFKPLAYALILLRSSGYPCIFYGDLYGIRGEHPFPPSCSGALPSLILARKLYAYGEQVDYFDYPTCIGWVRYGTWDRTAGCAVLMSNAGPGEKRMFVGEGHAGERWTDVLGWGNGEVVIGGGGWAEFSCGQGSVSVWVDKEAEGRERLGGFDVDVYRS